jgi:hypothetical protein
MNPYLDPAYITAAAEQLKLTGELPPPSEWHLEVKCSVCGHVQYPYAINPEFEDGPEGQFMTQCFSGSGADFCDECEDKGLPAMNMELVTFLHADQVPARNVETSA